MVRTLSAVILVAVLLPAAWFKQRKDFDLAAGPRHELVLLTGTLAAVAVMLAALFVLSSAILTTIVNYLQPVLVACYLTIHAELFPGPRWRKGQIALFMGAWLLGSVRSIGMSTWGLACAHDVGYFDAINRVRQELALQPAGAPVALSSAYLYEAARHDNIRWLHPDWLIEATRRDQLDADVDALTLQKPREMILTQFDYYRRWQRAFDRVKDDPRLSHMHIENTARTPAPDSIPSLQRVVQQISWAPVIVQLDWK